MADRLINIANFAYSSDPVTEAELAKIRLETEGIKSFLAGKNFVGMYWICSGADHGVKLLVKESDAKRAREVLDNDKCEYFQDTREDFGDESFDIICPQCNSENIEYQRFSKKVFYLSMLFMRFPLPFGRKGYRCVNCGHNWKKEA